MRSPNTLVAFAALMLEPNPNLPSTSASPASPNDNLVSNKDQSSMPFKTIDGDAYETEIEASCHTLDIVGKGSEANAAHLPEIRHEGSEALTPHCILNLYHHLPHLDTQPSHC